MYSGQCYYKTVRPHLVICKMLFVLAKVGEIRMTKEHLKFFSDYMIFSLPLWSLQGITSTTVKYSVLT